MERGRKLNIPLANYCMQTRINSGWFCVWSPGGIAFNTGMPLAACSIGCLLWGVRLMGLRCQIWLSMNRWTNLPTWVQRYCWAHIASLIADHSWMDWYVHKDTLLVSGQYLENNFCGEYKSLLSISWTNAIHSILHILWHCCLKYFISFDDPLWISANYECIHIQYTVRYKHTRYLPWPG